MIRAADNSVVEVLHLLSMLGPLGCSAIFLFCIHNTNVFDVFDGCIAGYSIQWEGVTTGTVILIYTVNSTPVARW